MDIRVKALGKDEPISNYGKRKSIQDVRNSVANKAENIKIAKYDNTTYRIGLYRNAIKVETFEVIDEGYSEDDIKEAIRQKIISGECDDAIIKVYGEIQMKRKAERKAKSNLNQQEQDSEKA